MQAASPDGAYSSMWISRWPHNPFTIYLTCGTVEATAHTAPRLASTGLSQTLTRAVGGAGSASILHFVNLWKTEAEREQPVLLAHRPGARKSEALAQPQHGFEALDRTPRRVEGLEAADPRHGPLHPEVITLDPLLQVLGDVMHRGPRQEAVFPGCGDGGWVGPRTIGSDPVGGEQRLVFQRLAEEALGRLQVAPRREEEINRGAVLVDGPVQIPPLAADLDVSLIHADRATMGFAEGPQPALDQRRVGQHPPVQSGVVDLEAALQEQLLDVAVAERIAQVPRDRLQDQRRFEVPALEVVLGAALQLLDKGVQDHRPPPVRRRICRPQAQRAVNAKTLRQGPSYCWRAFATAVANVLEGTASEGAAPSCCEPATRIPMISGSLPPKRRSAEPDSPGTELQL